jgi:hypothetical protein
MKTINLRLIVFSVFALIGLVLTPRFVDRTSIYTPTPIVDAYSVDCGTEIVLTVLSGDTLDSISLNYAIPKEYIIQYNRLKSDEVFPGMILLITMCYPMPTPTVTAVK